MAAPSEPQPTLQALERAFAILDLFTSEAPEWTTTEIARATGLPVATVHRILAFLRSRGYVERDEGTKRFRLGLAALRLGERARVVLDLRAAARSVLLRLARETDETALLVVLSERRDTSICLERVESSQPLRLSVEPGRRLPLHAGASQKALLAFMSAEDVEAVLRAPLERVCRATITDREALRGQLAEIRRRGWAISFEETNVGAWGVAVPLLSADGSAAASLGLAGPTARLSPDAVADHVARVHEGAAEIARSLGLETSELAEEAIA
ncbi:MAG: IclR family transcriptional regulator [Thermoleophilia bacterium]|nr:IclR family transcriptional regulator [Thermoleophilia bacterium]